MSTKWSQSNSHQNPYHSTQSSSSPSCHPRLQNPLPTQAMHHRCPQNTPASKTQAAQPKPENPKLSHCPCTDRSTTVTGCSSRIPSWHCSQRGGAQAHLPTSHVTGAQGEERSAHSSRSRVGCPKATNLSSLTY
jgi:hypothetical protein